MLRLRHCSKCAQPVPKSTDSCNVSKVLALISKNLTRSKDFLYAPILRIIFMAMLEVIIVVLHVKLVCSKDKPMTGAPKFKNRSRDTMRPLAGQLVIARLILHTANSCRLQNLKPLAPVVPEIFPGCKIIK